MEGANWGIPTPLHMLRNAVFRINIYVHTCARKEQVSRYMIQSNSAQDHEFASFSTFPSGVATFYLQGAPSPFCFAFLELYCY